MLPFVSLSAISTFASPARLQVMPALSFAAALYWARETAEPLFQGMLPQSPLHES
jgi:hypothetical protein